MNARASDEASTSFAELERAYPASASVVYGSVADGATASAVVQSAVSRHKRIDILVNNAGVLRENPLGMISNSEMDELFDVNLFGLMKISEIAAGEMARRRSGSMSMYRRLLGSKAARGKLSMQRRGLASSAQRIPQLRSLHHSIFESTLVAPGMIDTSMIKSFYGARRKRIESNIAMDRVGSAQDVAK